MDNWQPTGMAYKHHCPKYQKDKDIFYSRMFERDWYYYKFLKAREFATWFIFAENFTKAVDLLKLLNGETDYRREE